MNCEKQAIVFRNSFLIDYNFKGSMLHKSIHLFVRDVPVHTSVHKNLINKRIKDIINVICITFVEQKHFFVPKLNFFFIYRCFFNNNIYFCVRDTYLTNRCTTADCGESPVKKQNKQSRATTDYK